MYCWHAALFWLPHHPNIFIVVNLSKHNNIQLQNQDFYFDFYTGRLKLLQHFSSLHFLWQCRFWGEMLCAYKFGSRNFHKGRAGMSESGKCWVFCMTTLLPWKNHHHHHKEYNQLLLLLFQSNTDFHPGTCIHASLIAHTHTWPNRPKYVRTHVDSQTNTDKNLLQNCSIPAYYHMTKIT